MGDQSRVLTSETDEALAELARRHVAICGREDGACEHELAGADGRRVVLVCDPSGVAWWGATRTLLVADLHLEKGASFARRGQMLPPFDTAVTLERLERAVARWSPERIVALGDSFHDDEAAAGLTLPARRAIGALQRGRDWIWITGNHDPSPPAGLGGDSVGEIVEGGLVLRHEPRLGATPDEPAGEIAGHLHPRAGLTVRGKHIRRSCFAASATRMILPSFGAYTGGLSVFHPAFRGLFPGRRFTALLRSERQVFKVSASKLG